MKLAFPNLSYKDKAVDYWAIPYGETEVSTMLNQAEEVLTWFDDMTNTIPTWYMSGMPAD